MVAPIIEYGRGPKHLLGIGYYRNAEEARKDILEFVVGAAYRLWLTRVCGEELESQMLIPHGLLYVMSDENSTRTAHSTLAAARAVCRHVCEINAQTLSIRKGESAFETGKTFQEQGATALCARLTKEGWLAEIARQFEVADEMSWYTSSFSLISLGEGTREHPTQLLLDLLGIILHSLGIRRRQELGRLDRLFKRNDAFEYAREYVEGVINHLRIAFVGGLRESRVTHSWIQLARWFKGLRILFIAPTTPVNFQVESWVLQMLGEQAELGERLEDAIHYDVIYMIRVQMERLPEHIQKDKELLRRVVAPFQLTREFLDRFNGVAMDAKPFDELNPTIPAHLRRHEKVIDAMQSFCGPVTREEVLVNRHANQANPFTHFDYRRLGDFVPGENIVKTMTIASKHEQLQKKYGGEGRNELIILGNGTVVNAIEHGQAQTIEAIACKYGWGDGLPSWVAKGYQSATLGHRKDMIYYPNNWPDSQLAGIWRVAMPNVRLSMMQRCLEERAGGQGYWKVAPSLPEAVTGIFNCKNGNCVTRSPIEPLATSHFWVRPINGQVFLECALCLHWFAASELVKYTFG